MHPGADQRSGYGFCVIIDAQVYLVQLAEALRISPKDLNLQFTLNTVSSDDVADHQITGLREAAMRP